MNLITYVNLPNVAFAQIIVFLCLAKLLPFSDWIKMPIVTAVTIGSIFMYGNYRCKHPEFKDPLEKPLFDDLPWLDGWAFSHFFAFFLFGLLHTNFNVLPLIVGIGIAWEVFEHTLGKERPGWMGGYGGCNLSTDKNDDGNWWYGKWTDIVMNCLGLLLGYFIKQKFLT